MSVFDYCLMGLLAAGLIYGFSRGLIKQVVSIAGLVVAYYAAYRYFRVLSPWIRSHLPMTAWINSGQWQTAVDQLHLESYLYNTLAFVAIFAGVKIVLSIVGHTLNLAAKIPGIGLLNRVGGAAMAGAETLLLIILAIQVMRIVPSMQAQVWLDHSTLVPYLDKLLPQMGSHLKDTPVSV